MSCNTGRLTKKKILLLSLLVAGVTVGIYFIYSTTNNPAIAVAVPALAAFAICPAMCAIMGGLIWVMNRSSKNKGKDQSHLLNDEESSSCCSDNNLGKSSDYKIQEQEPTAKLKLLSNSNNGNTSDVTDDIALWSSQNREEHESTFRNLN
jgi:ABC-type transport system involved in multi-copper enzyme maturation permease subunit